MSAPPVDGLQPRTSYADQEVAQEMRNLIRMSSAGRAIAALATAVQDAQQVAIVARGPKESYLDLRAWDDIVKGLQAIGSLADELKSLKKEGPP